jgi:hypothetical protein
MGGKSFLITRKKRDYALYSNSYIASQSARREREMEELEPNPFDEFH